jgi:lipopolysaccharide export system permease protein
MNAIDLLPVAALMGALIGLGAMASNREITAIQTLGISPWRIALAVMKAAVLGVVIAFLVRSLLVPELEKRAMEIRTKMFTSAAEISERFGLWTRNSNTFLHIERLVYGRLPRNIEIFELGNTGHPRTIILADNAVIRADGMWLLQGVRLTQLQGDRIVRTRSDTFEWKSPLSGDEAAYFVIPARALPITELYRYIRLLEKNGLDNYRYRLIFFQQLTYPLSLLTMALLGIPFVVSPVGRASAGFRVTLGGGIGILFYLTERIIEDLALIYEANPVFATAAPDLLLFALAFMGIERLGRRRRAVRTRSPPRP